MAKQSNTVQDRRALLKAFGIGVPASIAAASTAEARPADHSKMTPRDVFEIYVTEYLAHLPQHFAKGRASNVRVMAEAQGAALAAVLARLQNG